MLVLALALCGFVDYATGHEVSVFGLYVIPILLSMRFFGTWAGGTMALLSAIVWLVADQQSGHHYSHPWFAYWNALHRLFFFACVVAVFHHIRAAMKTNARLLNAFSAPLPVCTHCHRIGAGNGYWQKFENYLGEHAGAQTVSKVCPDCARESYAKAGVVERASHR
ncbi:MAG: hypothetical protein EOP36_16600 [Rubrivivax sp.]|nr:MAG: hypothetical protein EOP36_16600 [Rubrivivax sp.]